MTRIAGHLLVECLVAQGVTHVFGVPGESYLAALDALYAQIKELVRAGDRSGYLALVDTTAAPDSARISVLLPALV